MVDATLEAEKGYREFHTASAEWAWKFAILRARVLHGRGMDDEAIKILTSEPASPPSGELAIQKLRWEGLSYASLHKFTQAEEDFREAEKLCTVAAFPVCAAVVSARGVLEMNQGHYAQAQTYFERVLPAARATGDQLWEANALLDLSWSALSQAHYDEALDWAYEARQISIERNSADLAQAALGNMGWAYYKLGDPEKALAMFVEARERARMLGDMADQVKWLTNAGLVHMDAHDFNVAEGLFRQSLDLATKIKSREDMINAHIALAFVSEQTGKLAEAKHHADQVLSMARADGNKDDEVYARLVQGDLAAREHDTAAAEAAFREVAQSPDAVVFLKWQAKHSLARLHEDKNQPESAENEYRSALSTFEGARANLKKMDSRLPFLTNATAIYDDYIHFLVSRGKTDEALQVADYSRARTLSEGLGLLAHAGPSSGSTGSFKPYPLNASQVARRAGGTILFYWLGDKQSYLWAITSQKTSLYTLPSAAEIEAAVQRYRKALVGPEDALAGAEGDGTVLYRMLVAPAQALLKAQVPQVSQMQRDMGHPVFIIPDGGLNSLNFEALLVSEPQPHYWIEDVTISNANSIRLLASSRKGPARVSPNILLFGDAVTANVDYPSLPKAALEMESIQKHFPTAQARVFAREQATPPAYIDSKPEQFSYIHFVTHGTASRLSPLESAIVLSKTTSADDSFKLYARDIIGHQLRADLVTVSECYGAGSRAYSGEGLVGLSWAFLRAGAHNVIGALWEVSDDSTPKLMDRLYGEVKKGKSPAEALRAAKLSLLHSNSAFRKPFYWAPFQLYTGS